MRGFTLVETVISLAVTLMVMAMTLPILKASRQGFISAEIQNSLKESDQSIQSHISRNLVQCKRIFENVANDSAFVGRIGPVAPLALAGSLMPTKVENGILSPKSDADRLQVGNSLLFARFDVPIDMMATATTSITAPQGYNESIRLDAYRFDYYYLNLMGNGLKLGDKEALNLWEWESIPYVDYGEILAIQNFTKSTSTVAILYSMGYRTAWLPSSKLVDDAFYNLYSSGTTSHAASSLITPLRIQPDRNSSLLKILTGITSQYSYGVSPNSGNQASRNPVPAFAKSNGDFPGGFEVQVVGNAMARQVYMRLVLMARGADGIIRSNEAVCLTSTKDVW